MLEFVAITLCVDAQLSKVHCCCLHMTLSEPPTDGLVAIIDIGAPNDSYKPQCRLEHGSFTYLKTDMHCLLTKSILGAVYQRLKGCMLSITVLTSGLQPFKIL